MYSNFVNFSRCGLEQLLNNENSYFTKFVLDRAHLPVEPFKRCANGTSAFYENHFQLNKAFNNLLLLLNTTRNTDSSRSINRVYRDIDYNAATTRFINNIHESLEMIGRTNNVTDEIGQNENTLSIPAVILFM